MVSPLPIQPQDDDTTVEQSTQPVLQAPAPTQQFLNGISPVTAVRMGTLLTRENIGWTIVGLVAADYFGITNQVLGLVGNVC